MAERRRRKGEGGGGSRRGEDFWRRAVGRWKRSGQTRAAFCDAEGLTPNTLTWWKWKLSTAASASPRKAGRNGARRQTARKLAASRRPRGQRVRRQRDRDATPSRKPRAQRPRRQVEATAATFLPVRVVRTPHGDAGSTVGSSHRTDPSLEVVLTGGRRLLVTGDFDPAVLGKLVATLEAISC